MAPEGLSLVLVMHVVGYEGITPAGDRMVLQLRGLVRESILLLQVDANHLLALPLSSLTDHLPSEHRMHMQTCSS